ncbi:MAG: purine-nucleoside phosphorylase [Bacilli bacterium]|nr:purine-nucleoside phosphorylase [Bacilli bacterium]
MSTPHIESLEKDICKTVIMPGDPLRAKYIADNYLKNARLINSVRNVLGYTGTYKGKEITVFASGMGNPSMGIYSYELYKYYNVENIIRIGTSGAYTEELDVMDLLLVEDTYSSSSYALEQNQDKSSIVKASIDLNQIIKNKALNLEMPIKTGRVHCGDALYKENDNYKELYDNYHCMAGEMETFALFHNAKVLNKHAACILTISNSLVTNAETSSSQREKGLDDMIKLALESAVII